MVNRNLEQNAKYELRAAGKSNRKRALLPPVGISGTAPNKNRSLLRLVTTVLVLWMK